MHPKDVIMRNLLLLGLMKISLNFVQRVQRALILQGENTIAGKEELKEELYITDLYLQTLW